MKSLGCSSTWIVPVWAFRRALRPELSLSSYKWAAGLVCVLWTCYPIAVAQKTPPVLRVDPFIQAIGTMKHDVAHVDCLASISSAP